MFQLGLFQKVKKTNRKPQEVIHFAGHSITIQRRSFQRSINLLVKINNEIKITCSKSCPKREIQYFLLQQEDWLNNSINKHKELLSRFPKKEFVQGENFLFLGVEHKLDFRPSKKKRISFLWSEDQELLAEVPADFLPNPELKKPLLRFYEKWGRKIITQRVDFWSKKMQLYPNQISFRAQKYRWGSCSSEGNLSLNWKLVAAPLEVLDYVVIHELAHLKHHNHSKRFWGLVEEFSPNYKIKKQWLKENQYRMDYLNKSPELEVKNA